MAAIKYDCYELVEWLIRKKGMQEEECGTVSKRLVQFADSFRKQFDEKICAYFDEASGTLFKKSEATEFLIGAFAGAIGGTATFAAGLGTSGFAPAQTAGQRAYGFMANKPREKAIKRTLKIQELVKETNIQKLFIKIATNLFIIHQQQLMKFIDDEDWLTNVERLVEDAVKIIFSYLEKCEKKEELKFESMALMAFLIHTNKNKTGSKMDLMYEKSKGAIKKLGRESKRLIKWEKRHWTFEKFDEEKCGFVAKINEEVKYFWTPTPTGNLSPPKYGFKLIPRAILDLIDENEKLHIQEYKPEEYYNYLLIIESDDELNKVVDLIKEIIANCATGINKDMHREIIDLRRHFEGGTTGKDNEREEKEGKIKREDIIPAIGNFTGRSKELTMIHEKLNDTRTSEEKAKKSRISPTVVVCGMGGIGKTELTRKYIEVYGQEYSSASSNEEIYWINAENAQNIANMQTFYKTELKKKLEKDGNKVLIVLDNVNTLEDARALVPRQRFDDLHVIITSRITVWKTHAEGKIETIRLIDFEGAYELIQASFPSSRKEDLEELIEILEGLPLALQQAIAYINDRQSKMGNYTVKNYLQEFEENTTNLLNTNIFKDCLIDSDRYNFKTVLTTFNISFELLKHEKEHGEEAEELMYCIAYLEPRFEAEFFGNKNALYVLEKYSLIKISGDKATVHRLVQEVARLKLRNVPNLEERVLRRLLYTKDIFSRANFEVFSERLQQKPHILKEYCHKTLLCEIPFTAILWFGGAKIFETMVKQECFNWREESVKETLLRNKEYILEYCDVNISCDLLNKLLNPLKNPIIELFDSISYFRIKNKGKEIKQQTFKLIALLCNGEEKSKEALLEHLSRIEDANLIKDILEMSDYYVREREFSFYKDLLKLAIEKDHPGILSNYLLKHLKQEGTRHLGFAIDERKENAFCELANKEYLKEIYNEKNIFIYEDLDDEELDIVDYVYTRGTLKMVKHLERVGFKNSNDLTFYLTFYVECEFEVFEYAFCNGAISAEKEDSSGRSVLFYAARAKRVDLFEFLIRSSEKCFAIDLENEKDKKGNTLLHYALSLCNMDDDDVDKDYIFSGIWDFLYADLSLIKVLLNAGVDPSKANVYEQTAFMLAAYWHREEALKCLLSTTDSAAVSLIVNRRCCEGRTALHYAAICRNYKQISNIISTFNTQSSTISPHYFIQEPINSGYTIEILLENGADAKQEDAFGCLPLHYASMTFRTLIKCELLGFELKEWPSLKDRQGNTPFHYAAIACNIQLLLELREIEDELNGESLNLKNVVNKQNQHLLHSFANSERYTFAHSDYDDCKNVLDWLIIKKGLDLSTKDIFGNTPMDYAREINNRKFLKAIEEI